MFRSASPLGFLKNGAIPIELAAARGQSELAGMLFPRTKPIPSLPVWSVDGMDTDRVPDIYPQTILGGRRLFPWGPVSCSISSAESKGDASKRMGHQVLGCCKSSLKMVNSKRMLPLGTQKRTFASMVHEAPVITQLVCQDDFEIKNERWSLLAECLVQEGGILQPIRPTLFLRAEDVVTCGDYETGPVGVELLRQASGLATVNLMRGRNVSKLMKMDNLLWSRERRILMFKDCCLVGEDEGTSSPYRAVYDTFDRAVEITTGYKLANLPHALPWSVSHLMKYLRDASLVDKRLISNHFATLYPWERIQRKKIINYVLRRKLGFEFSHRGLLRSQRVFEDIGAIFPHELLTAEGLHPIIDCWARKATENRGDFAMFPDAASPVMSPLSTFGIELTGVPRTIALGKILVALMRDPFEHPDEPVLNMPDIFNGKGPYDLVDIEHLLNSFVPRYGPTADASCLMAGLTNHLESHEHANQKPPYCYYTDISWEAKCPLVTKRDEPAECYFTAEVMASED